MAPTTWWGGREGGRGGGGVARIFFTDPKSSSRVVREDIPSSEVHWGVTNTNNTISS